MENVHSFKVRLNEERNHRRSPSVNLITKHPTTTTKDPGKPKENDEDDDDENDDDDHA